MRRFAKLCLSLLIMLQIMPATSIDIKAKGVNILDQNIVTLSTQHTPESVFDKNTSTAESNDLTLEVTVVLDDNIKEEKALVYKNQMNPGVVSVTAFDGYMLTSLQLDEKEIENDSEIIFEQTASKKLTIHVSTIVALKNDYIKENINNLDNKDNAIVGNKGLKDFTSETYSASSKQLETQDEKTFYTGFYLLKSGRDSTNHASDNFITIDGFRLEQGASETVQINNRTYGLIDGVYAKSYNHAFGVTNCTLKNNPSATFKDVESYFDKTPGQDKIDSAIEMNKEDPNGYDITWYRIVDETEGFHVDGYMTKKNTANIIFNIDGSVAKSYPVGTGGNLPLSEIPNTPSTDYQIFDGWYESSDFSGNKLSNDQLTEKTYQGNTTLYGRYIAVNKVKVVFNLNDGKVNDKKDDISFTIPEKNNLAANKIPLPNKTGYSFTGWKISGAEEIYKNKDIEAITFSKNITFIAQYTKDQDKWTTVTFEKGSNGTLEGDTFYKEVLKGESLETLKITAPTIIANKGYNVSETAWDNGYSADKIINEATTFTAQYTKDQDQWTTVTFKAGDNGTLKGIEVFEDVLIGETLKTLKIVAPTITANVGYLVSATPWDNGYSEDKVITEASTFTAQYQLITTPVGPLDPRPTVPTIIVTPLLTPGVTPVIINPQTVAQQQLETINNNETPLARTPKETVKENKTPLAKGMGSSWALLNLVCTILTVLAGIILIFFKRNKEEDEKDMKDASYKMADDESKQMKKRSLWIRVVGVVIAIISIVVFLLTENMSNPMIYVDSWTLVMVIIFVVQVITMMIGRKWNNTTKEDK